LSFFSGFAHDSLRPNLEATSLSTIKIHLKLFEPSFAKNFLLAFLSLVRLQEHVPPVSHGHSLPGQKADHDL